jgi:hypothetical protein
MEAELSAIGRAFVIEPTHSSQIEAVATALLQRELLTRDEMLDVCARNFRPITAWSHPQLSCAIANPARLGAGGARLSSAAHSTRRQTCR